MAVEKGALKAIFTTFLVVESFTLPVFRSGGRTGLSFWEWLVNHTVFGPPVEYVPEEDYMAELSGVKLGTAEEIELSAEAIQSLAKFYQLSEASARELVVHQPTLNVSKQETRSDRMVIAGKLKYYPNLLANVRNDGRYHPIRSLVQVDDPEVREIARVLVQADDFISATHEFVNSFTSYRGEIGDFWALPGEMLRARAGDCDDSAILLCSLLRSYIPPEKVFVAFGVWTVGGSQDGHAWVVCQAEDGTDLVLESTVSPKESLRGTYTLAAMFNDQYCFATDIGIRDFDLKLAEEKQEVRHD